MRPRGEPDLRAEAPEDGPAVREVHRRAFGGEEEARLVDALRGSEAFVPGLSLVAVVEGAVVGHVLFSRIRIGPAATPALALAPMAVVPELQRRGIGSRLVRAGLAECRRLGHRLVVVLGHPRYYPRFGFRPASAHGIRCPFEAPPEAFMVLELVPGALGVSGLVEYPRAFEAA